MIGKISPRCILVGVDLEGVKVIIGRKRERELLERAYRFSEAQFITIYGRLRVGKTYLIKEFFSEKDCIFVHIIGKQHGKLKDQLEAFMQAVSRAFYDGAPLEVPLSWDKAFWQLNQLIEKSDKKVVLFFDELPWLASRKSGLMSRISEYWNSVWAGMPNVILVAGGSSVLWMLKHIIYNLGGLYNRTTLEINLRPFKLWEAREYLENKGVHLSDRDILSLYMAVGGIPYYLNYVLPGQSIKEAIQQLFFDDSASLKDEYSKLFKSLSNGADVYEEIVSVIAASKEGIMRGELDKRLSLLSSGGQLSQKLKDLCDAGFIRAYLPWEKSIGKYYKVIDEFCLFYLHWVKGYKGDSFDQDHWIIQSQKPVYHTWSGYAFEAVCSRHIHQIVRTLGIRSVNALSSWQFAPRKKNERGAQIDLVIDRTDDAITLCEIKYTDEPFAITKSYAEVLNRKISVFKKHTKTKKQIFLGIVSANGLKKTMYSEEMVSGVVTLEDLYNKHI